MERMTSMKQRVLPRRTLQRTSTAPIVKRYGFVLPGAGMTIVTSFMTKAISLYTRPRRSADLKYRKARQQRRKQSS